MNCREEYRVLYEFLKPGVVLTVKRPGKEPYTGTVEHISGWRLEHPILTLAMKDKIKIVDLGKAGTYTIGSRKITYG